MDRYDDHALRDWVQHRFVATPLPNKFKTGLLQCSNKLLGPYSWQSGRHTYVVMGTRTVMPSVTGSFVWCSWGNALPSSSRDSR